MPHNGHLIAKFEEKRFMCLRLLWKIDFSNGSNILTECTFFFLVSFLRYFKLMSYGTCICSYGSYSKHIEIKKIPSVIEFSC